MKLFTDKNIDYHTKVIKVAKSYNFILCMVNIHGYDVSEDSFPEELAESAARQKTRTWFVGSGMARSALLEVVESNQNQDIVAFILSMLGDSIAEIVQKLGFKEEKKPKMSSIC